MKKAKDIDEGSLQNTQKIIDKIMSKLEKPFLTAERMNHPAAELRGIYYPLKQTNLLIV